SEPIHLHCNPSTYSKLQHNCVSTFRGGHPRVKRYCNPVVRNPGRADPLPAEPRLPPGAAPWISLRLTLPRCTTTSSPIAGAEGDERCRPSYPQSESSSSTTTRPSASTCRPCSSATASRSRRSATRPESKRRSATAATTSSSSTS